MWGEQFSKHVLARTNQKQTFYGGNTNWMQYATKCFLRNSFQKVLRKVMFENGNQTRLNVHFTQHTGRSWQWNVSKWLMKGKGRTCSISNRVMRLGRNWLKHPNGNAMVHKHRSTQKNWQRKPWNKSGLEDLMHPKTKHTNSRTEYAHEILFSFPSN